MPIRRDGPSTKQLDVGLYVMHDYLIGIKHLISHKTPTLILASLATIYLFTDIQVSTQRSASVNKRANPRATSDYEALSMIVGYS